MDAKEKAHETIEKAQETIKRVGGYLHRVVPIVDATGKAINYAITPLMVEFKPRDLMQVIVGASILAVPLAYTEETWVLGSEMPLNNVIGLSLLSLLFIGLYVYYNFYRYMFREHMFQCFKRVAAIYLFSLLVVAIILTLIQKCPWSTDHILAIKRVLIVGFPASMSAAVSDTLK